MITDKHYFEAGPWLLLFCGSAIRLSSNWINFLSVFIRERMQFYFGKRTVSSIAETRRRSSFHLLLKNVLLQSYNFGRARKTQPSPQLSCTLRSMQSKDFSTAKTLQNSETYSEMDTTTLKCQLKIHTSAFKSLTAATEELTNQTASQQSRKWQIFHIWKIYLARKHFGWQWLFKSNRRLQIDLTRSE